MYEMIFTFQSLTRAQQATHILNLHNIRASTIHAPDVLKTSGCGFAVKMNGSDATAAAMLFKQNHIGYLRSFRRIYNAPPEEVFL